MKLSKLIKTVAGSTILAGVLAANTFATLSPISTEGFEKIRADAYKKNSGLNILPFEDNVLKLFESIHWELVKINNRINAISDEFMKLPLENCIEKCVIERHGVIEDLENGKMHIRNIVEDLLGELSCFLPFYVTSDNEFTKIPLEDSINKRVSDINELVEEFIKSLEERNEFDSICIGEEIEESLGELNRLLSVSVPAVPKINLINIDKISKVYGHSKSLKDEVEKVVKNMNNEFTKINNNMKSINSRYMELSSGDYINVCVADINKLIKVVENGNLGVVRDRVEMRVNDLKGIYTNYRNNEYKMKLYDFI